MANRLPTTIDHDEINRILSAGLANARTLVEDHVASVEIIDADNKTVGFAEIILTPPTGHIELIQIEKGHNVSGKRLLNNLLTACEHSGVTQLSLKATDVGGYFWARCGFIPYPKQWKRLKTELEKRLDELKNTDKIVSHPEAVKLITRALNKDDPWAIALIADSTLGKEMLVGTVWEGAIDLCDHKAHCRILSYLSSSHTRAPSSTGANL
jgi:N-acetylglutamate synthase-like GNAT family acetyltransferase